MYTSNGLAEFYVDSRFKDLNGSGFSIFVLDTGFDIDHKGFEADLNKDGAGDQILRIDLDFTTRKNGITDGNIDHGTSVLGVIDTICPGVKLIPGQIATASATIEALIWANDNAKKYNIVAVSVSMSDNGNYLGDTVAGDIPDHYKKIEENINRLSELNIAFCTSAGNGFRHYKTEGVNGLGAFKRAFNVSNVNSRGLSQAVDMFPSSQRRDDSIGAPGAGLLTYQANGETKLFAGTSAAAPFFSACIVLLQCVAKKYLNRLLTIIELDSVLYGNTDPVGSTKYRQINVFKAAEAIVNMKTTPSVTPVTPV